MSTATRGRKAEARVFEWLTLKASMADFDFTRIADAKAGSMKAAMADFEALEAGTAHLVEVKEVDHTTRLPFKNFSADKVARVRKRQLAGAKCSVIVCFTPLDVSGRGWRNALAWRVAPVDFFLHKPEGAGSWVLSEFPLLTFDNAMRSIFV